MASPRTRSVWEVGISSRITAWSPPTWTVAPGTEPCSRSRSSSTRICTAIMSVVRSVTTATMLVRPSLEVRSASGEL